MSFTKKLIEYAVYSVVEIFIKGFSYKSSLSGSLGGDTGIVLLNG